MVRIAGLLALAVVGCDHGADACEVPAYEIRVEIAVSFDEAQDGLTVYWDDQTPSAGVSVHDVGSRGVVLRRVFATRADALAFDVPFVVRVADREVDRRTVSFADCDRVADIGSDPTLRREAVYAYSTDNGVDYLRCYSTAGIPAPSDAYAAGCELTERHDRYRLTVPAAGDLRLLVDGVAAEPHGIAPDVAGVLLEIDLAAPLDTPPHDVDHTLMIEQGGEASSAFDASLSPCLAQLASDDVAADRLHYQQRTLRLVDGVLEIDGWGGIECGTLDGETIVSIP